MKPSTIIALLVMVLVMLSYLLYGWLLYETITSEPNLWIKAVFATTFIFWFFTVAGLIFFAIKFWREKDHKEDVRTHTSFFNGLPIANAFKHLRFLT